jgi:hypothetical protein
MFCKTNQYVSHTMLREDVAYMPGSTREEQGTEASVHEEKGTSVSVHEEQDTPVSAKKSPEVRVTDRTTRTQKKPDKSSTDISDAGLALLLFQQRMKTYSEKRSCRRSPLQEAMARCCDENDVLHTLAAASLTCTRNNTRSKGVRTQFGKCIDQLKMPPPRPSYTQMRRRAKLVVAMRRRAKLVVAMSRRAAEKRGRPTHKCADVAERVINSSPAGG